MPTIPWHQEGESHSLLKDQTEEHVCRVVLVESEVEEQASINRSPTSYDANPEEERAR